MKVSTTIKRISESSFNDQDTHYSNETSTFNRVPHPSRPRATGGEDLQSLTLKRQHYACFKTTSPNAPKVPLGHHQLPFLTFDQVFEESRRPNHFGYGVPIPADQGKQQQTSINGNITKTPKAERKRVYFLTNLKHSGVNLESELEAALSALGEVERVRLFHNPDGYYKGFGFCEYVAQKSRGRALKIRKIYCEKVGEILFYFN